MSDSESDSPPDSLSISGAEWEVMTLLWEHAPRTSTELCQTLTDTRGWKRATVMTLLRRLIDKGAITTEEEGRRWLYSPAVNRSRCIARETRGFLDRVFQGALLPMVAHCLEHQRISKKEIAQLRAMLEEAEIKEKPKR